MVERFLGKIKDSSVYMDIVTVLDTKESITADDIKRLEGYCQQYLSDMDDAEYIKIGLMFDLLAHRNVDDPEFYSALELDDDTMQMIMATRDMASGTVNLDLAWADKVIALVENDRGSRVARAIMARMALDTIMVSVHFSEMRHHCMTLVNVLKTYDISDLDRYTLIDKEVRVKCKIW